MGAVVVFCTTPSEDKAAEMARTLVEERLAACVNIVPSVRSIYRWEGAIEDDREALMIIKTHSERLEALYAAIPDLHPYTVPEGIGWPVSSGLEPYLAWVKEETGQAG